MKSRKENINGQKNTASKSKLLSRQTTHYENTHLFLFKTPSLNRRTKCIVYPLNESKTGKLVISFKDS